jgi:cyclopropane-fatty-acyl-phospholipid synthase
MIARTLVSRLAPRLRHGTIVLQEGATSIALGTGDPVVHVDVWDGRFYPALLRGSKGLGDAYVRGWWDCDDLTLLVRVLIRNLAGLTRALDSVGTAVGPLRDAVALRRRDRDRETDRRNIHAHYDIGNDFYALMLDPSMMYSCGVFDRVDATLADAQAAKLGRMCALLDLSSTDHVLEIGTGWGGFAIHAATKYGCRVTTTTISDAQYEYARERVARAGLDDAITVLNVDYRDLNGTYDKLASIEMIEAIDWRDYDAFFAACARHLRPGGRAALQAIVISEESFDRAKYHEDFIRRYIFPGGCLPSMGALAKASSRAGFRVCELHDIGEHYPATLRAWRANVDGHRAEIEAQGLSVGFRRMWNLYLAYCEAAFLERRVSDVQLLLRVPDEAAIERDRSPALFRSNVLDRRERATTVNA